MKTVEFSKIIAACNLKLGRLSLGMSIEGHGHSHTEIKTGFSQKPLGDFNQLLHAGTWKGKNIFI